MAEVQFAAMAYAARSRQLLNQQCINAFVEPTPREGKTVMPVYGIPGLTLFSRMGNGPINGLHLMGGNLFVISGNQLWEITAATVQQTGGGQAVVATLLGTTTLGGLCSMADNGAQLVMVDGSAGWIYQPGGVNQVSTVNALLGDFGITANITGRILGGDRVLITNDDGGIFETISTGDVGPGEGLIPLLAPLPEAITAGAIIRVPRITLAQITAPAFMPADTVRYFDGYFVFNAAGTRQFFISAINDGTQYSGLDFATATAGSTFVRAVEVYHEQLLVMCQDRIEVWWDAGNVSFPFQRYDAALVARGLAAPYAICSDDNTIFWMGEDGIFYRLNAYAPTRISTFAMEHAWAQYPQRYLDASCFVLQQEGHKFIVINFPSGNQTWVYDIATGLWHQRESWGTRWV